MTPTCVVSVRLPELLAKQIRSLAEEDNRRFTAMVVILLTRAAEAHIAVRPAPTAERSSDSQSDARSPRSAPDVF